ncbi:MAG: response regulator [Paracoccaceae bacterium]
MLRAFPNLFARVRAPIGTKVTVLLVGLVALLLVLGAVGLGVLRAADQRTQALIDLQRRVSAYQALQSNTTALRSIVANAFMENKRADLDAAMRQIGQIAYDFGRAEFVAAGDARKIETIKDDYAQLVGIGKQVLRTIRAGDLAQARRINDRNIARLVDRIERLSFSLIASAEAAMLEKAADGRRQYGISQSALIATALGSVFVALIIGLALAQSVVRPVRRINKRLGEIAAGEFAGTLEVANRDELGELTENVNRMGGELETLYARLEAASRHKTEFLATMSHEIRTPMNAIIAMSELPPDTELTREPRDFAQTARDSGQSLLTIIDDILDFSKIEAGELELEAAPFDLRDCVESALDMIAHVATGKDLDLAYRIEDGVPEAVIGDITRLRQILINLLNNAVKFTEQGEVVVRVSYRDSAVEGRGVFQFRVHDTGIGIPAARIGRLFQPFKQVDASTRRRYGGTGLGLAICKRLSELMGGGISVESEVGKGTMFAGDVRLAVQNQSQRVAIGGRDLDSKTVMILCDGGSTNCAELIRYARAWGMAYKVADTPADAAEIFAAREHFDAVLIDADQYPADAPELQVLLSAAGPTPRIAMVRRGQSKRRPEGFTTFVQKPFKPSLLYDAFVEVLAGAEPKDTQRSHEPTVFDRGMARRAPLRILLADDHPTNQKLALLVLGRLGYDADTADNGRQALQAVARNSYDLVLMDIHMPEMDGLEATREMRRMAPGEWPRVVMMTANVLQSDLDSCIEAGAVDVVRKPIDVPKLISVLQATHDALPDGALRDETPLDETLPHGGVETAKDREHSTPASSAQTDRPAAAHGTIDDGAIETLVELIGGNPAMFAELVESFRAEAPRLFAGIEDGAAGDAVHLRIAAHTIKASAGDFGASVLADQCARLEFKGSSGDLDGAAELAAQAVAEWQAVERKLLDRKHTLTNASAEPAKDTVS